MSNCVKLEFPHSPNSSRERFHNVSVFEWKAMEIRINWIHHHQEMTKHRISHSTRSFPFIFFFVPRRSNQFFMLSNASCDVYGRSIVYGSLRHRNSAWWFIRLPIFHAQRFCLHFMFSVRNIRKHRGALEKHYKTSTKHWKLKAFRKISRKGIFERCFADIFDASSRQSTTMRRLGRVGDVTSKQPQFSYCLSSLSFSSVSTDEVLSRLGRLGARRLNKIFNDNNLSGLKELLDVKSSRIVLRPDISDILYTTARHQSETRRSFPVFNLATWKGKQKGGRINSKIIEKDDKKCRVDEVKNWFSS